MEAEPESNQPHKHLIKNNKTQAAWPRSINRSINAKFKMGSIPKAGIEKEPSEPNHLVSAAFQLGHSRISLT